MKAKKINPMDAMKSVTLNVTLDTRELRARLWIGEKLVRLAACVLNCGIRIAVGKTDSPPLPEPLPPPPPGPRDGTFWKGGA